MKDRKQEKRQSRTKQRSALVETYGTMPECVTAWMYRRFSVVRRYGFEDCLQMAWVAFLRCCSKYRTGSGRLFRRATVRRIRDSVLRWAYRHTAPVTIPYNDYWSSARRERVLACQNGRRLTPVLEASLDIRAQHVDAVEAADEKTFLKTALRQLPWADRKLIRQTYLAPGGREHLAGKPQYAGLLRRADETVRRLRGLLRIA